MYASNRCFVILLAYIIFILPFLTLTILLSSIIAQVISGFIYEGKFEGVKPLQQPLFPLSFEGEGDKGGEVDK